jgi:CRISPR-associated protein (TIGR02710 family)
MSQHILLICTVGGSPEPVVAALKRWAPARVVFVPTRQTRPQVEAAILPLAEREGVSLSPGCWDAFVLPDGQDFAACVHQLRELASEVERWVARGRGAAAEHQVVVDFTGGTKCMSAALAVQAHRWPCLFAYVGGTERTKNGVGVVVSGKEQVVHAENPWDALGYQAVEEAIVLFDQGACAAAARLLDRAVRRLQDPARKRELNALKLLAEGYDAWDRFDHQAAAARLNDVSKAANDVRILLGSRAKAEDLLTAVQVHHAHLMQLDASEGPSRALVADLLANARRRLDEGRYDDAVARLYRAIEALAQTRFGEAHGLPDTSTVPLDRIPPPLHDEWAPAAADGMLKLGLQDDYRLLHALGDPLGAHFRQLGLDDRQRSPLAARNASILAHGFQPIGAKVCGQLDAAALALAGLEEGELPRFPKLAG